MKYKNNPLNIRYTSANAWKGQIGNDCGFCTFQDISYGVRAAAYLLMISYRRKGIKTYAEIIKRFSPAFENPTQKYIDYVCDHLHAFPFDIPSDRKQYALLLYWMWFFEQGEKPSLSVDNILSYIKFFKLYPCGKC